MVTRLAMFLVFAVLIFSAKFALAQATAMSLKVGDFKHITFAGLTPTKYSNEGNALVAAVESSASFLVDPFDSVRTVKTVTFEVQGNAVAGVKDAAHESSKSGDDAPLRVGLILSGKPPLVPFFAPVWIKAVRGALKLPSDKLLYLIPKARHKAGEKWPSPHSDSIECLSLGEGERLEGEWRSFKLDLPKGLPVVGLWIMADGDNTKSNFTARLRNLRLE